MACSVAYRQNGRTVITETIDRLKEKIKNLETLSGMLPQTLTEDQDRALWEIAITLCRF